MIHTERIIIMHLDEKTLESSLMFDGKIIKLYKDKAKLENDSIVTREVIKHPGGVCIVPLTENNEILMVTQFRYPFGKILTEIPAGKLEWGENHFDCGKRELKEETGCTADDEPSVRRQCRILLVISSDGFHLTRHYIDKAQILRREIIPLSLHHTFCRVMKKSPLGIGSCGWSSRW